MLAGEWPGRNGGCGDRGVVKIFRWPVRVYYEDTDSGGVVYYANYLKFMERARTEWLRSLGFEQDRLAETAGVIFAVRSANLEFISPARFNDSLEVSAQLMQRRRASLTFEQGVYHAGQPGQLLCSGVVRVACLSVDHFKPQAIPDFVVKEIVDVD
jgi:acyl-CoA thioester hydrolase